VIIEFDRSGGRDPNNGQLMNFLPAPTQVIEVRGVTLSKILVPTFSARVDTPNGARAAFFGLSWPLSPI
jgi:hypothetical protein